MYSFQQIIEHANYKLICHFHLYNNSLNYWTNWMNFYFYLTKSFLRILVLFDYHFMYWQLSHSCIFLYIGHGLKTFRVVLFMMSLRLIDLRYIIHKKHTTCGYDSNNPNISWCLLPISWHTIGLYFTLVCTQCLKNVIIE